MAKTGSITITQGTQSIANNRTPITVTEKIKTEGESYRGSHRTGTITVTQNGTTIYSGTFTSGAPANTTTTLFSISVTVNHYSDGSSGTIAASYNYDSGWCSASVTTALTKIPRYASITSAPNFSDEENPTITYSNPAGSVVTSLQACISLTGAKADVPYRDIPINGTSYKFELTDEERKTLRIATTGSNSRTVKFYVKTVLAGVTNYSILDKTFTIINGTPTLEPTVIDINGSTIELTGNANILVRNFSTAQVDSGAEVYKDATISSQKVICGSKNLNAGSGIIENVGNGAFIFSVTDNRANTVTQTVNVPFIEYVNLTCNLIVNAPDAEGDMVFNVSGNCFSGSFGSYDNTVKVYYRYKVNSDEYCEWIKVENVVLNDNKYTAEVNLSGLDYQSQYTFQAMSSDALMGVESVERIVKTIPVYDWGESDFNFNVPININGDISLNEIKMVDYIVERGTNGIWEYTKWNSGKCELFGYNLSNIAVANQQGYIYRSEAVSVTFPFKVYNMVATVDCCDVNAWASSNTYQVSTGNSAISYVIWRAGSYVAYNWYTYIYVVGRWKE